VLQVMAVSSESGGQGRGR